MADVTLNIRHNATQAAPAVGQLADEMGRMAKQSKSASTAGTAAANGFNKIGAACLNVGKSAKTGASGISKFASSLGRIAYYRLIRTAIKYVGQAFRDGLKAAYAFSKANQPADYAKLAGAMDGIKSAAKTMSLQLGAAFGGLITAIAPVLIRIINLVTQAADAITRFFAVLNGSGYYKKASSGFEEVGESAGGAGKQIKGLLASWDELNVIGKESGGGGGGSSATDYSGAYEWVEPDADFTFFSLGEKLSEGLGNLATKISDFIKTPAVQNFGKNLADALNGAVSDSENWEKVGEAIGTALGTVTKWAVDFFDNVDWDKVWEAIHRFIKGVKDGLNKELSGGETEPTEPTEPTEFKPYWSTILDRLFPKGWSSGDAPKRASSFWTLVQEEILDPIFKPLDEWIANLDTLPSELWEKIAGWFNDLGARIKESLGIDENESLFMGIFGGDSDLFDDLSEWLFGIDDAVSKWINADSLNRAALYAKIAWNDIKESFYQGKLDLLLWANELPDWMQKFLGVFGLDIPEAVDKTATKLSETRIAGWELEKQLDELNNSEIKTEVEIEVKEPVTPFDPSRFFTHGKVVGDGSVSIPVTANYTDWSVKGTKNPATVKSWTTWNSTSDFRDWSVRGSKSPSIVKEWNTWDSTSNYTDWSVKGSKSGSALSNWTTWDSTANWNSQRTGNKWAGTTWNSTANWNSQTVGSNWAGTTWNSTAKFNARTSDISTTWDATAAFKKYTVADSLKSNGYMKIDATANIKKVTGSSVSLTQAASGGIYRNGSWRPIQSYAGGGSPWGGQIFRARENGNPELVGTIHGSTAVMNNGQIVSSVSAGVAKAISNIHFKLVGANNPSIETAMDSEQIVQNMQEGIERGNAEQNDLLREQNSLIRQLLNKPLQINPSAALGQVVARSADMYARA